MRCRCLRVATHTPHTRRPCLQAPGGGTHGSNIHHRPTGVAWGRDTHPQRKTRHGGTLDTPGWCRCLGVHLGEHPGVQKVHQMHTRRPCCAPHDTSSYTGQLHTALQAQGGCPDHMRSQAATPAGDTCSVRRPVRPNRPRLCGLRAARRTSHNVDQAHASLWQNHVLRRLAEPAAAHFAACIVRPGASGSGGWRS